MPSHEELTGWRASGWDELRAILVGLIGGGLDDLGSSGPMFRGHDIDNYQAGYVFETWVVEAFRHSGANVDRPYRVPRNPDVDERTLAEIDGLVSIGSTNFLIESKFAIVDFNPVARLHLLAEQRPVGTMGLLFAAGGYTAPALDSAHILRPIRVLLFEQDDVRFAAEESDIVRVVQLKWRAAAKYGNADYVIRGR